ncbi:hypothetical protein ILUMI_26767, partial [Ignelater luminosus]
MTEAAKVVKNTENPVSIGKAARDCNVHWKALERYCKKVRRETTGATPPSSTTKTKEVSSTSSVLVDSSTPTASTSRGSVLTPEDICPLPTAGKQKTSRVSRKKRTFAILTDFSAQNEITASEIANQKQVKKLMHQIILCRRRNVLYSLSRKLQFFKRRLAAIHHVLIATLSTYVTTVILMMMHTTEYFLII